MVETRRHETLCCAACGAPVGQFSPHGDPTTDGALFGAVVMRAMDLSPCVGWLLPLLCPCGTVTEWSWPPSGAGRLRDEEEYVEDDGRQRV